MGLFEPLFAALNEVGARYVVVGGVADVLHGHARFTADVDLVIDLRPSEALKAIDVLVKAGFVPKVPVAARDFADPEVRAGWVRDKGMRVFSLWDQDNPMRVVDLFVDHPIEFEALWSRSELFELDTTSVRIASIPDLIDLKERAGRPQDLLDAEKLREILRRREGRSRDE